MPPAGDYTTNVRTSLARMLGVSMSLATLLLIDVWRTVVQARSPQSLYLSPSTPLPTLEISALLNVILFTALFFLLMWTLIVRRERMGRRALYLPAALVGGLVFWYFAEFVVLTFAVPLILKIANGYVSPLKAAGAVYIAVCILIPVVAGPAFFYWSRKAWTAVETAALVLFPFAALCIGRTCWQATFPPHITAKVKASLPADRERSPKPLILWLMFDEMDQSAAFHHSLGDIELPNLSALRATAVHAERACEASDGTAKAIPSYTLGRNVVSVRWDSANDLLLGFEGSETLVPWTRERTLFHDASAAGRRTAILGYFHPYCRLFGDLTSACEVYPFPEAGELMKWWSLLQASPCLAPSCCKLTTRCPVLQRSRGLMGNGSGSSSCQYCVMWNASTRSPLSASARRCYAFWRIAPATSCSSTYRFLILPPCSAFLEKTLEARSLDTPAIFAKLIFSWVRSEKRLYPPDVGMKPPSC